MKNIRLIEKRLEELKRIVDYKKQLELETKKSDVKASGNNVKNILSEKSFRNWFRAYKGSKTNVQNISDNLEFVLKEDLMWKKYKTTVLDNKWIQWKPLVTKDGRSPQLEFLLDDRLEVFYGGACGGGKTVALLAGALQFVNEPN